MKADQGFSIFVLCSFLCAGYAAGAYAQGRVETHIVSSVELVQIPVIVFDNKGKVAIDLKKEDFRLFEDGGEQRILSFERQRVPVSFVILADLSSSMMRKIPFVQEAALSLLEPPQQEAKQSDEYSVLGIGKRSRVLMPFTQDEQDLERRVPLLLTATNESTALFDGVWLGVSTAEEGAMNEDQAMIVITDGGDNHSRYNLRETKKLLEEANFPLFAVMAGPLFELPYFMSTPDTNPSPFPTNKGSTPRSPSLSVPIAPDDYIGPAERRGPHNMEVLTEASGGGVFTAKREEDLPRIVRTIGLAVRYRYVLRYKPDRGYRDSYRRKTLGKDANLHEIRVELYPREKFAGYSRPYYKRAYHGTD